MATMADCEEITVTLFRPTSSASSLGLTLIDVDEDCPPAVCEVANGSPAADCERIEVGDVIIQINHKDVQEYTIKEVLKNLKLAQNPITLKLIRDPIIKNKVHDELKYGFSQELLHDMDSTSLKQHAPTEVVTRTNSNKIKMPDCETYVRAGDKVLKLSVNAEFSVLHKKNHEVQNLRGNRSSNKFQRINSNSISSRSVKCDRSNIAKRYSSKPQHPMSSTTKINSKDENITPSHNSPLNTIIKPQEKEYQRTCSEVQSTSDSDFLINSNEFLRKTVGPRDSTILARNSKTKKHSTKILCTYDARTDYQTIKQDESPDETKLVKNIENIKKYCHDKKNKNNYDLQDCNLQNSGSFPKAVDIPSANRLAKRLFYLDGFKNSDVSLHLGKNDEFSKAVAEKYLTHFEFKNISLDTALRRFLNHFTLTDKTQERERVLLHFSKRFLDCNPQCLSSVDAVYTLTCAVMQLNSHLHDPTVRCKITKKDFVKSLTGLNDNENFSRHILKSLYYAIKFNPIEWHYDYDLSENQFKNLNATHPIYSLENNILGEMSKNGSHNENISTQDLVIKKGYVMAKCCVGPFGKKTLLGKRRWKMYYCTLQNLFLYMYKCTSELYISQTIDNIHSAIPIHHALATTATDYTKKNHIFRVVTADQSEYLFQTCDSEELNSWIESINFACASFSAPRLPSTVGNQRKFRRPFLPSAPTKLNSREQLCEHEETFHKLKAELFQHLKQPLKRGSAFLQFYEEKETYLYGELQRYEVYVKLLKSKTIQISKYDSKLMILNNESEVLCADKKKCPKPNSNRKSKVGAAKYDVRFPRHYAKLDN